MMIQDNNFNNNNINQNNFNMQGNGVNNVQLQNGQVNNLSSSVHTGFQKSNFNQNQMNNTMYSNSQYMQNGNDNLNNNSDKQKNNKKILLIFLLLVLVIVIVVVVVLVIVNKDNNKVGNENLSNDNSQIATDNETKENNTNGDTTSKDEELMDFMFPLIKMYCKVPGRYRILTNGRIAAVGGNDEYIATIWNGDKGSYNGNLEDILTYATVEYKEDVDKYLSPNIETENIKINTTEKVVVSGYDAAKFIGSFANIEGWSYQIYGYSMIIDERPTMFLGILRSEEQAHEDLEEMKDLVDLMVSTIYKK